MARGRSKRKVVRFIVEEAIDNCEISSNHRSQVFWWIFGNFTMIERIFSCIDTPIPQLSLFQIRKPST